MDTGNMGKKYPLFEKIEKYILMEGARVINVISNYVLSHQTSQFKPTMFLEFGEIPKFLASIQH